MFDRLSAYQPQALALLRIVSGLLFAHTGIHILFGFPAATYPAPPAGMETISMVAGVLELVGGALLMVGLLTRPTAFLLSGMMAVAYWGFHFPMNPWPVNNFGAAAILFCFIYLYLFVAGPGAWAVDGRKG
jgi:putative oxidoreductase